MIGVNPKIWYTKLQLVVETLRHSNQLNELTNQNSIKVSKVDSFNDY